MSTPLFTVLIPTFNHAALLPFSLESLPLQKEENFEAFIVGDGATPAVAKVAQIFCKKDKRFSWHSFPKSRRTGETYRHELIITKATGKYIAYLADDDLWHPTHLQLLSEKLKDFDFIAAKPLSIDEQGTVTTFLSLVQNENDRKELLRGKNFIPVSCASHRRQEYMSLPHGWRTTPTGTPTDLYMWQQWCNVPGISFGDLETCTVLNFPSPQRKGWSDNKRVQELKSYSQCLVDEKKWLQLQARLIPFMFTQLAEYKQMPEAEKLLRLQAEDRLHQLLDSKWMKLYSVFRKLKT